MPQFLFSAYGASCLQWDTVCSVSLLSPHNSTGSSLQFLLKDCCFVQSFSVLFKTNQTVGFYSFRNKYAAFWDLKTHYAAALQGLYLLLLREKIWILVHDVGLGTQPKSLRPWISGESQVQRGFVSRTQTKKSSMLARHGSFILDKTQLVCSCAHWYFTLKRCGSNPHLMYFVWPAYPGWTETPFVYSFLYQC